ncbi:baseplate multidomain protein megatron [Aureimonas populi]|uniref:Glycoside hydrolase TIM-barrel-like domain-containing protein n=1 Tax=Aureimonas populi TaxID=1701758 RepID=A0ABW5CLU9_9HYPH|nr:glycoside hydrolase/phage tail family protein [Aureimonas populi]
MATILLQAAGGALGGLIGGPLGAMVGRAAGGLAGAAVDQRLFSRRQSVEGARLAASRVMEADEGTGIARLYGTARLTGQVIWTTRFEETRTSERQGGKGGGRSGGTEVISYSYFGNVAIGLCEGPVAHVRRIWADGEEMDLAGVTVRLHKGGEEQMPDPLIEAKQGQGRAPAYRGLAYLVFERLPLERWGNRIPQIACEVVRPIGELEESIRAVTIIPGASEHGLDTLTVRETLRPGEDRLANRNILFAGNDFSASLEELTALCPRIERAALIVSWFADDLRVGRARVRPGVEVRARNETVPWRVQGLSRAQAHLVSRDGGGPAYGGTPSDAGVVRAIRALKARGLKVTHYPFLMMDVPGGNVLPDPYGGERQAPYPWRGRMTLDIAEGRAGSADGTAAARMEIAAFTGTAVSGHFSTAGGRVSYFGPAEWSYRRMVLHQAFLAQMAGGVDAFVIGSEMRGLTRLRDEAGRFPFVEALIQLARDVKAILPGAKITYAADWSEYFGYQPADGSGDVFFNLDPLWADAAIDMVGIDSYLPLADWRAGDWDEGGPDAARSPYDRDALMRGIEGGEYFDWYYASEADRRERRRTPITDGAGKPWVYRAKDLRAWWANPHVERRGGVETGEASAWVPCSKPIWLTELGCPAIDKGANQPNVFVDPKSSESLTPHFSTGARDDHQQRRFLEAHLRHWESEANPVSPLYGGRMVETGAIHLWTWDARPYPAFPERRDVWSDGSNWERGHWLTGRLGKAPLDRLVAAILRDHGIEDADVRAVDGEIGGYVLMGAGSVRGELEELMRLGGLHAVSRAGRLSFAADRDARPPLALDVLAQEEDTPLMELRRTQESESAQEVILGFADPARAYQRGTASAALREAGRTRLLQIDLPVTLHESEARRFARSMLMDGAGGRERAAFALPPGELAPEPGDVATLPGRPGRWRIERIEDGAVRRIKARRLPDPALEARDDRGEAPPPVTPGPVLPSRPLVHLMDLPLLGANGGGPRAAVFARPWMPYAVLASAAGDGFTLRGLAQAPAILGELAEALAPGPPGRLDRGNAILVDLAAGAAYSTSPEGLLSGRNAAAILSASGAWEVVQFETAQEVAPGRFRLEGLLRAQGGTDDAMEAGAPAGSTFVLLDEAAPALELGAAESGAAIDWRVVPAGRALDDEAALASRAALGQRRERALSPVHLRGAFLRDGALQLGWVRRSRIDADRWEAPDVPLGEESEAYVATLSSGGMFVEVETDVPRLTLGAQEQVAAFGGLPAMLDVEICQIGAAGRGVGRRAAFRRAV